MKILGLISILICLKYTQSITSDCAQSFTSRILYEHNRFRALHGSPDLVNDQKIINIAQSYAQKLASTNSFAHSRTPGLGENLAMVSSSRNIGTCEDLADRFTKMWYDEVTKYNFNNPGFSMQTGHFTQVVWKSTTKLGCGLAIVGTRAVGVCNYSPPGNMMGAFVGNVLPIGSIGPNSPKPTSTQSSVISTLPPDNNQNKNCCPCDCSQMTNQVRTTTTRRYFWRPTWNRWGKRLFENDESDTSNENRYERLFD